jgi:hypothetical protein
MKKKLLVKYISIIFMIATFMGSLHHHNDLQEHNNCQICTISHNVANIDTPIDVNYLVLFTIVSEATLASLPNFQIEKQKLTFSARAPPLFS